MKPYSLIVSCLITSLFTTLALAAQSQTFKQVHSPELAQWLKATKTVTYVFDANTPDIRKSEGLIPSAMPLTSSSKYRVSKELPQDKSARLVFYCANEQCTASHNAAKRAMTAGYKDVYVLPDGIFGWKKQGFETVAAP